MNRSRKKKLRRKIKKLKRKITRSMMSFYCLLIIGDNEAFNPLKEIKKNETKTYGTMAPTTKRKHEEDWSKFDVKRRNPKDIELGRLLDFAPYMVSKLESDE